MANEQSEESSEDDEQEEKVMIKKEDQQVKDPMQDLIVQEMKVKKALA